MMKLAGSFVLPLFYFSHHQIRDFLTGFHKRKVAKAEAARKKAQEREKQSRLEARREVDQIHHFGFVIYP